MERKACVLAKAEEERERKWSGGEHNDGGRYKRGEIERERV